MLFPDLIPIAVTPAASTGAAEIGPVVVENQANRDRQRFAEQERTGYVMRLFKKGMPNYIRAKLLEKEYCKTFVQDLCTITRQQLYLRELCPVDEMAQWSNQRSEMGSKVDALTKQLKEQNETFKNQIKQVYIMK